MALLTKTPANGRIHIFDRSWYRRVLTDRVNHVTQKSSFNMHLTRLSLSKNSFCGWNLDSKFFLHISKKEQEKRFRRLEELSETKWRVTKEDWKANKNYEKNLRIYDEMLEKTDTEFAPWTIIEATDRGIRCCKNNFNGCGAAWQTGGSNKSPGEQRAM